MIQVWIPDVGRQDAVGDRGVQPGHPHVPVPAVHGGGVGEAQGRGEGPYAAYQVHKQQAL